MVEKTKNTTAKPKQRRKKIRTPQEEKRKADERAYRKWAKRNDPDILSRKYNLQ